MRKLDFAWAGGIVDGEGCITIQYSPAHQSKDCVNDRYRAVLRVAMGCKKTVTRLCKIVGHGKVYSHKGSKRTNPHWSWLCQAREAEKAIKKLRPFMFTKANEVDVALEFLSLPNSPKGGRNNGKFGSKPVPPWLQRRRNQLYWKIRKLKPRFKFPSKRWVNDEN